MDTANIQLVGRLVRDPVFYGEGKARRSLFTVAVNRGRDENKKATFIDCIAWGKRANLLENLTKGNTVFVLGQLEMDSYTRTNDDGEERKITKLQVNVDTFMAGRPSFIANSDSDSAGADSEETLSIGADKEDGVPF